MALIKSANVALGTALEHFTLEDPFGKQFSSQELFGKGAF